jgi:hypothetical protein
MIDQNESQSDELFSRKWLLLVCLCLVPLFLLFGFLGYPGKGRAATLFAGVVATAIRASWNLRKHVWYRVTVTTLSALHLLLVLLVPWPSGSFPAVALLPVAVADFAIVYGSIKLAEKLTKKA